METRICKKDGSPICFENIVTRERVPLELLATLDLPNSLLPSCSGLRVSCGTLILAALAGRALRHRQVDAAHRQTGDRVEVELQEPLIRVILLLIEPPPAFLLFCERGGAFGSWWYPSSMYNR